MRATEINLIGLHKLQVKLEKNMDLSAVKTVVKKNGAEMQKKAQKRLRLTPGICMIRLCWKLRMAE